VFVDGVKVASIDQHSEIWDFQRTWISDLLTSGTHLLRIKLVSGSMASIDAIKVVSAPTILSAGTYDDANPAITYVGSWYSMTGADGYYQNSQHYTVTVGGSAQAYFTGRQIGLTYLAGPSGGIVDVYVDGVKIGSIDQSSQSWEFQKTWTSVLLTAGNHTLSLVYVSGGSMASIDGITVIE
jgi:hypothetical protein